MRLVGGVCELQVQKHSHLVRSHAASHAARCHWLPLADRFLHLHLHDNPLIMRLAVSWAAYVSGASQDCSPSGGQCSDRRPEVLLADFTAPAAGGKGAKEQDGAKQQDAKGPKSPAPSAQGGGAEVRSPVPPCSRKNSHLTFTARVHSGCCTAASPRFYTVQDHHGRNVDAQALRT